MSDGMQTWRCYICCRSGPGPLPVGHADGLCGPTQADEIADLRKQLATAKERIERLEKALCGLLKASPNNLMWPVTIHDFDSYSDLKDHERTYLAIEAAEAALADPPEETP